MAENNIGASRLIGTNGLQQAVDSLTSQVNRISNDFSKLSRGINNAFGSAGRMAGGSQTGNNWNSTSNRTGYSSNGGGATFAGFGRGGTFGAIAQAAGISPSGGARIAGGASVIAGAASALTSYGNSNMSSNMQMNMFAAQSVIGGGTGPGGYNSTVAMIQNATFGRNYAALNQADATRAAFTNTYTFGNMQFGGVANPAFMQGQAQVNALGYLNPTLGASAAATAAQQSYTARAAIMSRALGLQSTIGPGGVKASMSDIANSIYRRTFGNRSVDMKGFSAANAQGGSLDVNLQYFGQQMGWNQTTIQEYRGLIQGRVAAQNAGMAPSEFNRLTQQAAAGDKAAQARLKPFGVGASMFEQQRNLNSTRMGRQADILGSLAPAFDDATNVVNDFSQALTNFLKNTGLDKAIGGGAGWSSALSGGLSGFSSGFGAMGGMSTAMRLFGGGRAAAGGLGGLGGMGGGGAAVGGASLVGRAGMYGASIAALAGAGLLGWKGAVPGEMGSFGTGFTKAMELNPLNPIGVGMLQVGMARRAYDKFITGKNKESVWSIMNPWGTEKRMTNTDGRPGGGTNSNSGGGGSSGANGSVNGSGASAMQVIQFAESQLGVPYVWGGTTPGKGLDCSGLIQWAFGKAGVSLPRTSQEQQASSSRVSLSDIQPGDLLFKGDPATHVAINIGNGKLIEAPRTGLPVRIRSFSSNEFTNAGRVVGSVGNAGSLLNQGAGNAVKNTLNNQQSRVGGNAGDLSTGAYSERSAVLSALAGSIAGVSPTSRTAGGTSGSSQLGTTPTGNGGNDKASLQTYAKQLLAKYGWAGQWNDFDALVMSESSWDYKATNPSSGAYGLPQALPASKMSSAGADWRTSGDTQLRWMMDYVKGRYGSPSNAWSFHQKNNWYAAGAWSIDKDQNATVHQGEMIIPADQAETIRQTLLNNTFNPNLKKESSGGSINIGRIEVNLPQGYSGTRQEAYAVGKSISDSLIDIERTKRLKIGQ